MRANNFLRKTKPFSEHQFAVWRILFGVYCTYYSVALLPYVTELFSSAGIYASVPVRSWFPNILYWFDSPAVVLFLAITSVVAAIAITVGYRRCLFAGIAWYIHACWFGRNVLTDDPSLAYIGLLFLLLAIIPSGEVWSLDHKRKKQSISWQLPYVPYITAVIALGIGYSVSGIDKLHATGWWNGDAMYFLLHGGLTNNNLLVTMLQAAPDWAVSGMTWYAAWGMAIALPGLLWKRTRFVTWLLVTSMFVAMAITLDLAQVTIGMLVFHLFIFDREWIPAKKKVEPITWYYDTNCNLCQSYKKFIEKEDHQQVTAFKSIYDLETEFDSMILEIGKRRYTYSDSALQHWHFLGGMWRLLAWSGALVPKVLRDHMYKLVARNRYRWFGTCGCD